MHKTLNCRDGTENKQKKNLEELYANGKGLGAPSCGHVFTMPAATLGIFPEMPMILPSANRLAWELPGDATWPMFAEDITLSSPDSEQTVMS